MMEVIPLIARTWHGVTEASKADEYVDYLNKTGIPEYHLTPGNLGVIAAHDRGDQGAFPFAYTLGIR